MPNEISTVRRSLAPTTYAEACEFAQHLAKSSMVPNEYRGKPENILLAIQWGMEVGLAPLQAIQNIAVINGKPSVYGDALLAMVKGSSVCDDVIERVEGAGDNQTAICEAKRIGKAPVVARFSVTDAKAAHLWGKQGPWTQYPRRMLQMRARGFALRDAFPDVLRGVITREEAEDYPVDVGAAGGPIDVTPRADLDRFAALPAADQPETSAEPTNDELRLVAEQTAMKGTEAFRAWWKTLGVDDRAALKPDMAEYRRVAEEADSRAKAAAEADEAAQAAALPAEDEDPFGLPPLPKEPASPAPAERPGEDRANTSASSQPPRQGDAAPADLLGDTLAVPFPRAGDPGYFARQMLQVIGETKGDLQRLTRAKIANDAGLQRLKKELPEAYDEVMAALASARAP